MRALLGVLLEVLLLLAFPVVAFLKLLALPYAAARRLYDRLDAWIEARRDEPEDR